MYETDSAEVRIVRVQIFDVLYNDKVCYLVYLQD